MKRFSLKTILLTCITLFSLLGVFTASFAWFVTVTKVDDVNGTGSTNSAYFAYGDGSAAHPFGISNLRHLNNLAWLQYKGMFDNGHYHFELANDINVGGGEYVIPPIGTEDHPFKGVFSGIRHDDPQQTVHTIHNIKVTNVDDATAFSNKPKNIDYTYSDFDVVGLFGFVGKKSGDSYAASDNAINNVILDGISVESTTEETLIGLAAGYVNAEMSGVKVEGTAKINIGDGVTTAKTIYTDQLSKYALVGYSTKTGGGDNGYNQSVSSYYDAYDPSHGGKQRPGLGGHTSLKEIYDRLDAIPKTETHYARKVTRDKTGPQSYENEQTVNIPNSNVLHDYKDNANYKGSFCFSDSHITSQDYNIINLTGKRKVIRETADLANSETMFFINGSHILNNRYLPVRNDESSNVFLNGGVAWEDEPSKINGWYSTETNFIVNTTESFKRLYSISGGKRYYLYLTKVGSNVLARQKQLNSEPTGESYTWNLEYKDETTVHGKKYTYFNMYAKYGGTKYYLNTGSPTTSSSGDGKKLIVRKILYPEYIYDETNMTDNNETYFPLLTSSDGKALDNNTGYVVSSADHEPNVNLKSSGAISVSKHKNSQYTADTAKSKIKTIYNGQNVDISTFTAETTPFDEFDKRYSDFNPTSSDYSTHFYGLMFRDAAINVSNTATIEAGKLNGSNFTNRVVPRNCIDFSLASKGTTAFFAGTYQTGVTTAFFSLHKINRNGSTLSSIEEIYKIYKHPTDITKPYVYITSASTPSIPTGYVLAFDTDWITNPAAGVSDNKIYYFEIPLNQGEYALGSVPDKGGAYLMYLDIGASNVATQDTITGYTITTSTNSISYPLGVDFNVTSVATHDGGDTICFSIATSESGEVIMDISSSKINFNNTTSIGTYTYINNSVTVTGKTPGAIGQGVSVLSKTVYATVTYGETIYSIVIVGNTSFTVNDTSYESLNDLVTETPFFSMDHYNALVGLTDIITLTKKGSGSNFNTTPIFQESNVNNVVITLDVTGVTVTATIIDGNYTFYKNSVDQSNVMTNGDYSF